VLEGGVVEYMLVFKVGMGGLFRWGLCECKKGRKVPGDDLWGLWGLCRGNEGRVEYMRNHVR
jgi:hypothetical protein